MTSLSENKMGISGRKVENCAGVGTPAAVDYDTQSMYIAKTFTKNTREWWSDIYLYPTWRSKADT